MRRGAKPAKSRVEAKPPIVRKSRKSEGSGVQDLEKRLAEALEQQTATAEILRVISSSPTEVQPVLDAIAERSVRLCGALFSSVYRFDGELIHMGAHFNYPAAALERSKGFFPTPPHRRLFTARAILERTVVHVPDVRQDAEFMGPELVEQAGFRAVLSVPMLLDEGPVGAITVWHAEVGAFTDKQIELLQTFADQAVIAIENVRLFKELEARNRDLTATSEILRVISSSPTHLQPVLDAVAENAARVCGATDTTIRLIEGDTLPLVARFGTIPLGAANVIPLDRDSHTGRTIVERRTIHIEDMDRLPKSEFPRVSRDVRTVLATPLMREGVPLGAILIRRVESQAFTQRQIDLLKTFADQAVIAIENVRLFTELQQRNEAVTRAHAQVSEALERQTATSEILRVISSSPTDVHPVFDAIANSAVRLTGAVMATVYEFDGSLIHLRVLVPGDWPHADDFRLDFPRPPAPNFAAGRVILERAVFHRADLQNDPDTPEMTRAWAGRMDTRSVLWMPMLLASKPIGVIGVVRREPGLFSDEQVRLLQTFADQAVVAIENVRLFKELEARNRELTQALDRETATGEILRVINRSPTSVETVFGAILDRGMRLCQADVGLLFLVEGDTFQLVADRGAPAEFVEPRRSGHRSGPNTGITRAVRERRPIHIEDLTADRAYTERDPTRLETVEVLGARSGVWVPLLKEEMSVGVLVTWRREVRPFTAAEIDVLTTFANQAVIALENVRLLQELEKRGRQLEAASQHKSEFLANMSHELRTPLNAVIGFSEVLSERMFGELNEKQAEYVQDINASGTHLLSLINDILDLSKIEAGRMELELADFHLPQAIENALVLVRERALRRGITLEQSIDPCLGEIQGDERKIKQVLLNLLSNAIKFTPEGGRVGVRAEPVDEHVEVAVSDTGVGIAPEDQEAVFEEFRQVGTAEKRAEGTGLGLALARKFIELHGGRIWVKSQLGAGSTFTFTLPVRRGE